MSDVIDAANALLNLEASGDIHSKTTDWRGNIGVLKNAFSRWEATGDNKYAAKAVYFYLKLQQDVCQFFEGSHDKAPKDIPHFYTVNSAMVALERAIRASGIQTIAKDFAVNHGVIYENHTANADKRASIEDAIISFAKGEVLSCDELKINA